MPNSIISSSLVFALVVSPETLGFGSALPLFPDHPAAPAVLKLKLDEDGDLENDIRRINAGKLDPRRWSCGSAAEGDDEFMSALLGGEAASKNKNGLSKSRPSI